tara:strand:+ start:150 stop:518 length:369 start_codon:yes stop_codon:yes gene_type:complete
MKLQIILNEVNEFLNIDIKKKTRKREYVYGRFLFYKLVKELNPFCSTIQIGRFLDKNHATVLYGNRELNNIIKYKQDPKLIATYKTLLFRLKSLKFVSADTSSIRTQMIINNQKNMRKYYAQ